MWVPICAPPKLLYHIDDRFRGPINETKCLLGVYKVKESNGSIFEAIQYMQHPQNANFLLFFAIFHYFTLFTPSPGPPYLTRGFYFMLFIFRHILVPSPGPYSTQKPFQSQNFPKMAWYWWLIPSIGCTATLHPVSRGCIQPPGAWEGRDELTNP